MTATDAGTTISGRGYRRRPADDPGELRALQELAGRLWAAGPSRWHPGELAWFRLARGAGLPPGERIAVWECGERTVAWAWARTGPDGAGRCDLQLDPAHPELAGELLDWFEETAGPAGAVTVLETDAAVLDALGARGYREVTDGPFFVHLRRELTDLSMPHIPEGYWLRHVRGEADAEARAAVHRAAFTGPDGGPAVTAEGYRQVQRGPGYRRELDWMAGRLSDGRPVAFCLVWLDEVNAAAALEPVGTDPAHRRLGLAGACVLAALHGARRTGARTARVCARGDEAAPAALAAYTALGFRPFARNRTFRRTV